MHHWERLLQTDRSAMDYQRANFFIESPNFHARTAGNPRFIVIHTTGGNDISGAINEFLRPGNGHDRGKSAHYIVDRNGQIYQMVRENSAAGHCANLNSRHNLLSIGIEHVASVHSEITLVQSMASMDLVRYLSRKHGIPLRHDPTPFAPGIRGHGEQFISSTHNCPNPQWNWDEYIRLANLSPAI